MVATLSGDLRVPTLKFPDTFPKGNQIWHAAIVLQPEEGKLDSETWERLAQDYMTEMGLNGGGQVPLRWFAVNHGVNSAGSDHVHIAANLIRENGIQAKVWMDMPRSQKVAMLLEERYDLKVVASRYMGVSARGYGMNDLKRAVNTGGKEPRRIELERKVRVAAVGSTSEESFVQNLEQQGLRFRGRKDHNGTLTGYSVNLPETTTAKGNEHWWAGGKLARDLSLPRLRLGWEDKTSNTPSHIKAVDELVSLQRSLPTASFDQVVDASHQMAGALAAVSQATEDPPGELARASHHAGKFAQTRTYVQKPKPPALSIGLLFLQCMDPAGPVGKTVMLKQLMATYRALLDAQYAQRGLVTAKGGIPGMSEAPEEELVQIGVTAGVTAGAMVMERHARTKEARAKNERKALEPWDAKAIRKMRVENEWLQATQRAAHRPIPGRMTQAQADRIQALADEFEMPAMVVGIDRYTEKEAAAYIESLEAHSTGYVPEKVALPQTALQESDAVEAFMADLEAKHGDKIPEQAQPSEPSTVVQRKWLTSVAGLSPEDAEKMTKEGAAAFRTQMEQRNALAVGLTPVQTAKNGPGKGRSL
jgi:hypothetical protein